MKEQKEEETIVAKSRLAAVNLSSTVLASSSSTKNMITSSDPVKLMAARKPASRTRRNSKPDEAPISHVKLKDVYLGGLMDDSAGKPVATDENQVFWEVQVSLVAYMDKVYSIVRKTYDRGPTDEMEDLIVNAAIWRMFMNTTLQAAVHLGQDYDQNLRFVQNHFWSSLKTSFKETEKLIKNQTDIIDVSMIDHGDYTWSPTSLFIRSRMSRPNVFADSVLCLGGRKENPNEAWKEKIKWYFESNHLKDLNRIDEEVRWCFAMVNQ